MSNILYLASLNPNKFGSIEEHALFLCRELKQRGHVCYLGFVGEPDPAIRQLFENNGAQIVTIDYNEESMRHDIFKSIRTSLPLVHTIRKEKIDLVHINFFCLTNAVLWGVYLSGAKLIFTDHTSGLPLKRSFLKLCLVKVLHFFMSQRISRYIGVSNYVRERMNITHHVLPPKAVTLYNGVNIDRFVPGDSVQARNTLGLPQEAAILCSVAMLIPEKGIQHLIEAVALMVHEHGWHDLLIIVVGEGYYRENLEQLAHDRGVADRVLFWGRRSDVQTIIAASDVVVVPPVWEESFGLIIAEAMASARPVVATRVGGIPELIEDGCTGMLVNNGDVRGLALSISTVLSNSELRQRLTDAALVKVSQKFNLVNQVQCLVDIYEELIISRQHVSMEQ